jgi:hypothetical protein
VSTALASAGTAAWPFGLPGRGSVATFFLAVAVALGVGDGAGALDGSGAALDGAGSTNAGDAGCFVVAWFVAHAASIAAPTRPDRVTRRIRTGGC